MMRERERERRKAGIQAERLRERQKKTRERQTVSLIIFMPFVSPCCSLCYFILCESLTVLRRGTSKRDKCLIISNALLLYTHRH